MRTDSRAVHVAVYVQTWWRRHRAKAHLDVRERSTCVEKCEGYDTVDDVEHPLLDTPRITRERSELRRREF